MATDPFSISYVGDTSKSSYEKSSWVLMRSPHAGLWELFCTCDPGSGPAPFPASFRYQPSHFCHACSLWWNLVLLN